MVTNGCEGKIGWGVFAGGCLLSLGESGAPKTFLRLLWLLLDSSD